MIPKKVPKRPINNFGICRLRFCKSMCKYKSVQSIKKPEFKYRFSVFIFSVHFRYRLLEIPSLPKWCTLTRKEKRKYFQTENVCAYERFSNKRSGFEIEAKIRSSAD